MGHHWRANTFVTLATLLPLLALFPFLPSKTAPEWSHRATLAYLTAFGLSYAYLLLHYTIPFFSSPHRNLPQIPPPSFLLGGMPVLMSRPPGWRMLEYMKSIPNQGLLYFRGLFYRQALLIGTTPEVCKQVLNDHAYDYQKPKLSRDFLRRFLGDGLVVVEGSQHKLQRKAVAPAFSGKHINDLVPLMWRKSRDFVEVVASETQAAGHNGIIEVGKVASHVTLDIIGVACLGRDFKTLYNTDDELAQTYEAILNPENPELQRFFAVNMVLGKWLTSRIPFWKTNRLIEDSEVTLRRICGQLLAEGKASMSKESKDVDILSVLLRSSVELTDEDLISQLLTFLAAGHETTSSALTWTCYLLAKHPAIQAELRNEITSHIPTSSSDEVTAETFENMPLLEAITKESFRLYPTVPGTIRRAVRDTYLHIDNQVVPVPAGTEIILPIWGLHRLHFGADAEVFRPSRWLDGTANKDTHAFMTFLHGPRSCIGQNFARYELRCLISAVVGRFEMKLTTDKMPIPTGGITIKPMDGMYLKFKEVKR